MEISWFVRGMVCGAMLAWALSPRWQDTNVSVTLNAMSTTEQVIDEGDGDEQWWLRGDPPPWERN